LGLIVQFKRQRIDELRESPCFVGAQVHRQLKFHFDARSEVKRVCQPIGLSVQIVISRNLDLFYSLLFTDCRATDTDDTG